VIEANDGDVAVEMIHSHPDIDLVILDLKMPRMSGKEALKTMRETRPDIKYGFFIRYR
jgi:CheY-like chemotaxis protein